MIVHNVIQGSPEWNELKLGIPSASEFNKILTPTGKLSSQASKYAFRLVAEKLLNHPTQSLENLEWVEHGKATEAEAVSLYEFQQDVKTTKVGFCTTDDGEIGASPDRFVGDEGSVEIKCVAPQTHIGYLIEGLDKDYIPQLQGQLYVTGRSWVDWWSYNPYFHPVCIRVQRDEPYIELLDKSLREFVSIKNNMLEKIRAQGYFEHVEKPLTPVDVAYGNLPI